MKIVCDTNVLVSGILFEGAPRRILRLASQGKVVNCVSSAILGEAEDVLLRPKFGLDSEQVRQIIDLFRDTFEFVVVTRRVRAVHRDPADDRIIETALAAGANRIVSGDRDLLDLGEWRRIPIVSPARFMAEFHASAGGLGDPRTTP